MNNAQVLDTALAMLQSHVSSHFRESCEEL